EGRYSSLIDKAENIALIVNDRNRPTPTYLLMRYLLEEMPDILEKIKKVFIATGTHKEPTEDDLRTILGDSYSELIQKVHIHRAKDSEAHKHYGKTARGTPLFFDREMEDHDLYVFLNSVEPHYFAGFTGGRKSIIPGMAYYGTVEWNHQFALDAGSKPLGLEGNPVHEDMVEAAEIYLEDKEHISIQMVQGPGRILTGVHVGDIFGSFNEAVENARKQFCLPVNKLYDIVVTVAKPPMDRTLYQAQKAIENGKLALKDGGVLVLLAECGEGIGASKFWELLTMDPDPNVILDTIDRGYVLGYHKAAKIVQLHKRATIMAVTGIPAGELAKGFIGGFVDLDEALSAAKDITGTDASILVIPDGTVTVPLC
ncbi:MAG: nickel-dependent lactate racemase, partial [Thermoplasmatota archaeon]